MARASHRGVQLAVLGLALLALGPWTRAGSQAAKADAPVLARVAVDVDLAPKLWMTARRRHVPDAGLTIAQRLEGDKPLSPPPAPADPLAPFRGLSTWIDTYDTQLAPQEQVRIAAGMGVNALFVQVSRESTDGRIHDYDRLSALIEGAHDAGMYVMVWTIPDFEDLDADRARAQAAMAMRTPRGDRPDAFGLDIEVDDIAFAPIRTRRLMQLSEELRAWVGPGYPMAAIVLNPRQLERNTRWWRDFPYAELTGPYDVFVPMSYSSYRGTDATTTYNYNHDNVVLTRQMSGDPTVPIHLAGGIADNLPEVAWFVQAAIDTEVIGAGLYDLQTTRPEAWPVLRGLAVARPG